MDAVMLVACPAGPPVGVLDGALTPAARDWLGRWLWAWFKIRSSSPMRETGVFLYVGLTGWHDGARPADGVFGYPDAPFVHLGFGSQPACPEGWTETTLMVLVRTAASYLLARELRD